MTGSFESFLIRYSNKLIGTGKRVRSIAKLASRLEEHPRAYEPVTLLAVVWGREDVLLASIVDPDRKRRSQTFLDGLVASGGDLISYLKQIGQEKPRDRYWRVLEVWHAEAKQKKTDDEIKADMANRIAAEIERIGISRSARICGVNKGNLYAFARGDISKMSKLTALKTFLTLRDAHE